MDVLMATPAWAEGAPAAAGGGEMLQQYALLFLLLFGVWYFMLIRPQRKRQQEQKSMLDALQKGDRVVTIGGMHGTVDKVEETVVVLRVDDNARVRFSRSAIAQVNPGAENADKEKGK